MNAVAAMNSANTGGPVGGGMMMMNNGSSPAMPSNGPQDNIKVQLNTYIYEYFLRVGLHDLARNLVNDPKCEIRTLSKSPNQRKNGDMNGDGVDSMDMDGKDDIPDDLPRPTVWENNPGTQGNGFLLEWFSIFSDLFAAHRNKSANGINNQNPANQYLINHQQLQRMREGQGRPMPAGMMNNAMMQNMRAAGGKMGNVNAQQLQAMAQNNRQKMQMQMNRGEQADGEINGRPGTPADGDNGGSPSKRPRLEGQQQFNGAMMPNGRPAGVPAGAQQNMMIQSGFQPNMNNAQFRQNGAMPQKGMQGNMANNMMNMGNAGSPMMQGMNFNPDNMPMDLYNNRNMPGGQPMQGGPAANSGNHALQDYQMQLMLLEQQNKKRLMMARQEQHENAPRDGPIPGMPNAGMSPNSRTGTSPNPEGIKRTPQIGGPNSPSAADIMQGRSPAGMNFMNGMQPPDFNGGMMMGAGGPGMRPPTSNDMNMRGQQNRAGNQFQGGQPMAQQASQPGQQPMGTPGQRTEMPPPQAPAGGSAQRTQTGSPAAGNAPPTPSQASKPNPKNKKGKQEDNKRNRPTKKGSTANANATDENPPATPTPSTPITANNPGIMNANKGQQGAQANPAQNAGMQPAQPMQQQDLGQFGQDFSAPDGAFNLDFTTLENADVLENFDFDSFLNTSADDGFNFDASITVDGNFGLDPHE